MKRNLMWIVFATLGVATASLVHFSGESRADHPDKAISEVTPAEMRKSPRPFIMQPGRQPVIDEVISEIPRSGSEAPDPFWCGQPGFGFEGSSLQIANSQRQELIQSLQALQDAYCREAKLDEALAVRDMIRVLREQSTQAEALPEPQPVISATGDPLDSTISLTALQGQNGTVVYRRLTGTDTGSVYGGEDNVYTDDSDLATAAVHAGVLTGGQQGIVRVTILPERESYPAITRHELTSRSWEQWGGSYRVDGAGVQLETAYSLRGQDIPPLVVYVVGSMSGTVWGSGTYTDDSNIGTAAVHAGLLKPGEAGFVMLTLEGGKASYESTTQNGITTHPYHAWEGSYRLSAYDVSKPVLLVPVVPKPLPRGRGGFQLDVF